VRVTVITAAPHTTTIDDTDFETRPPRKSPVPHARAANRARSAEVTEGG
jgi:hypothetical protein